jgi:molecular chaperone DnaK (HSP70)
MRMLIVLSLLVVGCSGRPEGTAIEGASVATTDDRRLTHHLGIAAGSRLVPVMEAGCQIPCTATQRIRTESGSQKVVRFQLHEGADDRVASAKPLGTYEVALPGTGPAASEIELRFHADRSGAYVSAVDRADGSARPVARASP